MDEEVLKNLENISDNLEYLIQYLQETNESKNNNIETNTLETISNDFSSFNTYLKSIDSNIKVNNQKISAYLDSITTLENNNIGDNPELQQFNQSITNLISKLDDLKTNISDINANLNLNLDAEQIESIKNQLNSDLVVNLDIDNLNNVITEVNEKLESLNNVNINLEFGDTLQNLNSIVTELNNLKNLNLDDLNLEVTKTENVQKIIEDLNKINELSNLDLNNLTTSLQEIQNINLDNLNIDKISISLDTTNLIEKIDSINLEFEKIKDIPIELNFNLDYLSKIEEIKTELTKAAADLKMNLTIEPEVNYKVNPESLQTIKTDIENVELSLNPDDELITKIKTDLDNSEFNVKVNPIFDNTPIIETRNETEFKVIKDEEENPVNNKLIGYMEENNKLLKSLLKSIDNISPQSTEVINVVPENVSKPESVVNITPEDTLDVNQNNETNTLMISLLKELVDVNRNIARKLTKSSFNTDLEL